MNESTLRPAAVAGHFYTADRAALEREVRGYLAAAAGPSAPAVALMAPHAGLMYSGAVAGLTYAAVEVPARVVVLAVNHRGAGEPVASWSRGAWDTPLGRIEVDEPLVAAIARRAPFLRHDPRAHWREHSLEVQLPFLHCARPAPPRIAPVSIASHDWSELERLGQAVAAAVEEAGEPVLIVASSDMTHYEDADSARRKDLLALAPIEAVDGRELARVVAGQRISMCGVAPTCAALVAARALGARCGRLVAYANSGEVSGDMDSVVGYAGVVFA